MVDFDYETKVMVVNEFKSGRYTVLQIANKYSVSIATVYRWVADNDKGALGESNRGRGVRKVTPEIIESIIKLYEGGHGLLYIGKQFSLSPMTVKQYLIKNGVYKGTEKKDMFSGKLRQQDREQLYNDFVNNNLDYKALRGKYKVTNDTIRTVLKEFGITAPVGKGKGDRLSDDQKLMREQVVEYYKTGLFTHSNLAERYNVSTRTISRILDKAGIEATISAKYATSDKIAEIKNGVLNDSLNGEDRYHIAIKYGVTLDTINRIISSGTQVVSEGDGGTGTKRSRAQSTVVELFKGGYSFKQIAQKTELSVPTVKTILKDLGIDHKATKSSKYKEDVLNDFNEGLTIDQIADKYSLSTPTVRLILKNGGVQNIRAAKVNLNGTKKDRVKDEVIKAYLEGLSAPDIAKRCGVSAPTVRTILRENDTPVRKQQMTPFMASRISELWKNFCDVDTVAKYVDLPKDMVLEELKRQGKTV